MRTKDTILLEEAYNAVNKPFSLILPKEYNQLLFSKEYTDRGDSLRNSVPLETSVSLAEMTQALGTQGTVDLYPESGENNVEVGWNLKFNNGAIAEIYGVFPKEEGAEEIDSRVYWRQGPEGDGWEIIINPQSKSAEVLEILKKVVPFA
jgi:hypothetical protein